MARISSVLDFIDRGNSCSSGPESPVDAYDRASSFINDNESTLFVSRSSSVRPSVEHASQGSEIRGRRHSRGFSRSLERRLFSDSRSLSLLSRRAMPQLSQLDQFRQRSKSPSSVGETLERYSRTRSRSTANESGHIRLSGRGRSPSSSPNPRVFPDHLELEGIAGIGLPGIRLGDDKRTGRVRYASRYFLLTYAQCGYEWPYQALIVALDLVGGKYRMGRERHQDGGYHFHCFVDFERKFDFENVHKFCVGQRRPGSRRKCPGQAHCNILPLPRTPYNTWDYVAKFGDVVACNVQRPPVRGGGATRDDHWAGSFQATDQEGFFNDIKKHSPRDWCLYGKQIQDASERHFGKKSAVHSANIQEMGLWIHWERFPEVREWVVANLSDAVARITRTSRGSSYPEVLKAEDEAKIRLRRNPRPRRPKSLVLYGDTHLGKTDFARGLGFHIDFHGDTDLESLIKMDMSLIEYAIFDDVSWKKPCLSSDNFKHWAGCQYAFNSFDRYTHKVRIEPWGKPSIFCVNKHPTEDGLSQSDFNWLLKNCVFVDIGDLDADRSRAISSADVHEELREDMGFVLV